jgi:hypothetical protein
VPRTSKNQKSKLYGTKQVAEMLGLPVWRVKNFSEGKAFRLPPSAQLGTGHGSRRLYDWKDVCRIAIADKLTTLGFTPETVGAAIREIPDSKLQARTLEGDGLKDSFVLVRRPGSEWQVAPARTVGTGVPFDSCAVIPFQMIIHNLEYWIAHDEVVE